MHPPPTSVQSPENIQFPNISNLSPSQSHLPNRTNPPIRHSEKLLCRRNPTTATTNGHSDRSRPTVFPLVRPRTSRPAQRRNLSSIPRASQAPLFSCHVLPKNSSGGKNPPTPTTNVSSIPTLWNFSTPPVSNELRNARTSHPCERGAGFLKSKTIRKLAPPITAIKKFVMMGGVWCVQNLVINVMKIVLQRRYARASWTVTPSNSVALDARVAAPCCFPCSYKSAFSPHLF